MVTGPEAHCESARKNVVNPLYKKVKKSPKDIKHYTKTNGDDVSHVSNSIKLLWEQKAG